MFGGLYQWRHIGLKFFFFGRLLTTNSISLQNIILFRQSLSEWAWAAYVIQRICLFHLSFPVCGHRVIHSIPLVLSERLQGLSPLLFLLFIIYVFWYFCVCSVWLDVYQFYYPLQRLKFEFHRLTLFLILDVIDFSSFFLLLALGLVWSPFYSSFKWEHRFSPPLESPSCGWRHKESSFGPTGVRSCFLSLIMSKLLVCDVGPPIRHIHMCLLFKSGQREAARSPSFDKVAMEASSSAGASGAGLLQSHAQHHWCVLHGVQEGRLARVP